MSQRHLRRLSFLRFTLYPIGVFMDHQAESPDQTLELLQAGFKSPLR
jgi:hypothetical protein